jgi:hypothetical protein
MVTRPSGIRIEGVSLLPEKAQEKVNSKNLKYYYESAPDIVISNPPNISYKYVNIHNTAGFNERYNYEEKKRLDNYRIVTLGDSFTYGLYVNTEDNWTEILENLLNKHKCVSIKKFEVINLGNTGYDIRYAYERFLRQGKIYKPDLLLWLLNEEDFIQNNELLFPIKEKIKKQLMEEENYESLFKKHPYPEWGMAQTFILREYSKELLIEQATEKLFSLKDSFNGDVVYLVFPSLRLTYMNLLKKKVESNQHLFLFANLPDVPNVKDLHFPNDSHPNLLGHRMIAESIASYIIKNKVSCR